MDNVRPLRSPRSLLGALNIEPGGKTPQQRPGSPPETSASPSHRRRIKLRHVLFLCLVLSGIIPLAISSMLLIQQNRGVLIDQERQFLVNSAEALSRQVNLSLSDWREDLHERGENILALPGAADLEERLRQDWVQEYLESFVRTQGDVLSVRALDLAGQGRRVASGPVAVRAQEELNTAFEQARSHRTPIFRLAELAEGEEPLAVLAVPVFAGREEPVLIMQSVNRLGLKEAVLESGQGEGGVAVQLADRDGRVLWADAGGQRLKQAVEGSGMLASAGASPLHFTQAFRATVDGERQEIQMTVSPIGETGWQVAVMKPLDVAFAAANRMIYNALLSSVLLVFLALLSAAFVARWVGEPLQRLAETTHAIAAGDFQHRLETNHLTFEMAELAENFNLMSGHVDSYVEQLKEAARANQELFLGSIRAFAATIDAKDPYTRGHSERVAAMSRAVAKHMGLEEEFQQRVWLGALLHDVGKIGIDDRVLKKGDVLTPEEYEQMKLHTVIGAEIVGRIDQLKEIVPAVRWHHENWNGRGYPDGLKGEQIPLIARIICVTDTFDAVTTSRPYQQAYTLEFAVNTITKLTGTRFDAKVVTAFLSAFNAGQIEAAIQRAPSPTEALPVGAAFSL